MFYFKFVSPTKSHKFKNFRQKITSMLKLLE